MTKPKTTKLVKPAKHYTLKGGCNLEIQMTEIGLILYGIDPLTKADRVAVYGTENNDDGEFSCWDADVKFASDGSIVCGGYDGTGGSTNPVILTIPFKHVKEVKMTKG